MRNLNDILDDEEYKKHSKKVSTDIKLLPGL